MAIYGAKHLVFSAFSGEEPAAELPNYTGAVSMSELVKVADSPEFNTAPQYGDNKLVEEVTEFKTASIDVEVADISNMLASEVTGASIDETDGDLEFGADDTAPFGGLAFYVNKILHNKKKFQGIFYPKVKAAMQGEEYATKGESITLANGKLKFSAFAPNYGKWKIKSKDFDTEAEAKAWVDSKLPPPAAPAA